MRDTRKSKAESYICSLYGSEPELMQQSRLKSLEFDLERISLSPVEGSILSFLMALGQCQKVVEIGTLTGLSAQYLLKGMGPQANLWTLEKNEEHFNKAESVLKKWAEQNPRFQIHPLLGDARIILPQLSASGPFDAVFVDGNKAAYGDYASWAIANLRIGGLLIMDNVFLGGAIWGDSVEARISEKQVKVIHETNLSLVQNPNWLTCLLPTPEGLLLSVRRT